MEIRCGSLLFTSKFDSGNLARVERVSRDEDIESKYVSSGQELRPDYEYQVWTKPDCYATEFENGNRSWFYFGIRGYTPNKLIKITIMNMNRQCRLYNQGHCPFYRMTHPSRQSPTNWARIRDRPTCETVDGQFFLTFVHRFLEPRGGTTYFAFCFPWSYTESQEQLAKYDQDFVNCERLNPGKLINPDDIYYHRELLCLSLEKWRVDLITISDCFGMESEREERFDGKLFPESNNPRPWKFKGKKVYLVSSRVHPGETPASYVFNGFIKFILRKDDPRAQQLRRQFVFKLIPMLNPDGVVRGHYRTDTRGVNLNRVYLDPDFSLHPTIYAAKALLVHHHVTNRMRRDQMNLRMCNSSKPVPAHVTRQQTQHAKAVSEEAERMRQLKEIMDTPLEAPSIEVLHAKNRTYHVVHDDSQDNEILEFAPSFENTSPDPLSHPEDDSRMLRISVGEEEPMLATQLSSREKHVILDQEMMSQELLWSPLPVSQSPCLKPAIVSMKFSTPEKNIHSSSHQETRSSSTTILGNEGSDGDSDDEVAAFNPSAPISPHLCDPRLLEIPPDESGISFYVDLHGHCSKRGCFMYGNSLESEELMIENLLFPKLISLNTAHFDFSGCNFSVKNMYQRDKRDGLSKEGAGRVAIWKHLGLIHSYTLECNYNTGRMVNHVPAVVAGEDGGRATPPPIAGFPPKYTISHYEEVGRAMAVAALDMFSTNPWSRINSSEMGGLVGIREWVRKYLRGMRGGPRYCGVSNTRSSRFSVVSGSSCSSSQSQAYNGLGRQATIAGSGNRLQGQHGIPATNSRFSRANPAGASGVSGTTSFRKASVGNGGKSTISQNANSGPQNAQSGTSRPAISSQTLKPAISKPEKPTSITRQSISHLRQRPRNDQIQETSLPSCAVAISPPTCSNPPSARGSFMGQPSTSQLPGSVEVVPTSVGTGGAVSDGTTTDEAAYRQKAARVLLQMEMISCGTSVPPLRQRPLNRSRPSAGAIRTTPVFSSTHTSNPITTTVGDSRLVLLPYDSSMSSTKYSNSSPVLPQMSGFGDTIVVQSRPSAACSDPVIQHSTIDQKVLEDRKVEKLRNLKDPKRRRHDGSGASPPHRLGTLKMGTVAAVTTHDNGGRRKSRRSMSFGGKSMAAEASNARVPGPIPTGLCGSGVSTGGTTDNVGTRTSNSKSKTTRHRRRKTGLHGKQAVYSEGDVGKDENDEDSSSPSDIVQTNEKSELQTKELPIQTQTESILSIDCDDKEALPTQMNSSAPEEDIENAFNSTEHDSNTES